MSTSLSQDPGPGQSQSPVPPSLAKSNPVLLTVVIGLGVAIIVVLGLMIGMAIKRATAPTPTSAPFSSVPVPNAGSAAVGGQPSFNTLYIREGTSVAEARVENGMLVIRTTGDAADEVIMLNPTTGQLISRITLKKSDEP